jgi:hypothetical protein
VGPVDASLAPTTAGNYRLRYGSPAIDAGDNTAGTVAADLDGNPRVIGLHVDTGGYEHQAYALTVYRVGAGEISLWPDQPVYTYFDQVVLTATAESGWTFAAWSGDVTSGGNPLVITVTGDAAITATFSRDEYTLTVNRPPEAGGSVQVAPEQPTYHYGEVVTLTATSSVGWSFVVWSGALRGTDSQGAYTVAGNTVATATFAAAEYTLNVNRVPVEGGDVEVIPQQATYHYGDVVTLTATANAGWAFVGRSGDQVSSLNRLVITIAGDTALTATFGEQAYTLSVTIEGAGTVSRQPDQATYTYRQQVVLTATVAPGWAFAGWSGDQLSSVNPLTMTVTGSIAITARFVTFRVFLLVVARGGL